MNKLILVFFIICCWGKAFSQEKTKSAPLQIVGSKELPLELNLMLENLQQESGLPFPELVETILHIDSYARVLSKEDIFLLGKIEIYKTLLRSNSYSAKAVVDGNSTKTLKDAIKNSSDPFVIWFLQALLHDCEALLGTDVFKDYLLQKNAGRLERLESKKINKKVQLLYRWISKIKPESADFQQMLIAELQPVIIEALKNIEQSFFIMASSTIFQPMPAIISSTSELKFFSLKKAKMQAVKVQKKEKSVDDILAPITDEGKAPPIVLPKPSSEDWLEDQNAPLNLKNLPKPSDDADWLQDF